MKIAIISACSAGIASTYMAAESLELAAKKRGHKALVETQGTIGIENKISNQDAQSSDIVIIARDIKIQGMDRFKGLKIIEVGVAEAIRKADSIIAQAEKEVV